MKRVNLAVTAVMITALAGWGCATKKYVAGEVGQVSTRVDGVQTQVEDAQTKIKVHEGRISKNEQDTAAASKTCLLYTSPSPRD